MSKSTSKKKKDTQQTIQNPNKVKYEHFLRAVEFNIDIKKGRE